MTNYHTLGYEKISSQTTYISLRQRSAHAPADSVIEDLFSAHDRRIGELFFW